jgi:hypothetical protein
LCGYLATHQSRKVEVFNVQIQISIIHFRIDWAERRGPRFARALDKTHEVQQLIPAAHLLPHRGEIGLQSLILGFFLHRLLTVHFE